MYSYVTPAIQRKLFPGLIWQKKETEKCLYLTFDDGPDEESTDFVLDLLTKFQAKSTFFLVGKNMEQHPDRVHQIVKEGHSIGNHSYSHLNGWKCRSSEYLEDVRRCQKTFEELSLDTKLFRPPYGRPNFRSLATLKEHFEIVMWSHLSGDFDPKLDIKASIKSLKKAESGAILLFHSSPKAFSNMRILLPEILKTYSDLGYSFEKLA